MYKTSDMHDMINVSFSDEGITAAEKMDYLGKIKRLEEENESLRTQLHHAKERSMAKYSTYAEIRDNIKEEIKCKLEGII